MPEPGSRLGGYELIALIGRGGMGAVYRARDCRLDRDVAIKVLPDTPGSDPDRAARFAREARVLASLSHPYIGTIYGIEEIPGADGSPGTALVLELVEGPTLSEKLASGPLALPDALRIARQVAEALEAAHDRGIIHRDLKPSNIKLTLDGTAKVLDFGLAKLVGGHDRPDASASTVAATHAGMILGTPAYMSPEQARGEPIDKRTDIWSFGCVLYELLTGRAAFAAQTLPDCIAAVLNADPDWDGLPRNTPAPIRTLLQRCLEKDPRQRLRDAGDARIEIDSVIVRGGSSGVQQASVTGRGIGRWSPIRGLAFAGVVVAATGLGFVAGTGIHSDRDAAGAAVRTTALLPPGVTVTRGPGMLLSLALSPDGRTLVIAGTDENGQRLFRRSLGRLEVTRLEGTEGALAPFFSPDGAWVGFFADRRVKRVPAAGGTAVDIADAPGYPGGASWGKDNRIVFASGAYSPLRIANAWGGAAETLTTPEAGSGDRYPEFLPDGRHVLFSNDRSIYALEVATKRRIELVEGSSARYASSGYLLLNRGTALLAAPFDRERLEITGPIVPVVENVAVERSSGAAPHAAISPAGTLAYVPAASAYALVLVQPDGAQRVLAEDRLLQNPQFSPDGRKVVVAKSTRAGERPDLWLHDLTSTAPPSRLTFDGGRAPLWMPDGSSIIYSHPVPSDSSGIYMQSLDGRGPARQILPLSSFHWLVGWTRQGVLAYGVMEAVAKEGITRSSIAVFEDGKSRHLVGPGDTWGGRLSADGRWLAYYSRESGDFEIYVTPFPNTGAKWLIAEGTDPVWSPDESEIYYRNGSRLMAARIDKKSGVRVLSRRVVIEPFSPPLYDDYAIHPDGRTLALVRPAGNMGGREITLVFNWLAELRASSN